MAPPAVFATLNRAVWVAYGWDDPVPAEVEEDTILSRLLALNGERALSSEAERGATE